MQIIKKSRRIECIEYSHVYEDLPDDGTHSGFSFPCDAEGNVFVDAMKPAGRENYQKCLDGTYNVIDKGVRDDTRTVRLPAVGRCTTCRAHVVLDNAVTNECTVCGSLYNGFGQDLLPEKYWREGYDDYDY